LITNKLKP